MSEYQGNQHPVWDMVDGILVINLDSCPERMTQFLADNQTSVPVDKVQRLVAVDGRKLPGFGEPPWFMPRTMDKAYFWGGTAGCAMSHRKAIQQAKDAGWKNVLILEDDVIILSHPGALSIFEYALKNLTGKYMLYLGYSRPTPYGKKVYTEGSHALWRTEGVLSTYGYLVPESLYDDILQKMPTEDKVWDWLSRYRAIDSFYRDNIAPLPGVKIFMVQPDLIDHVDGLSSIANTVTDTSNHQKTREPYSYTSPAGLWYQFCCPFRKLKNKLKSIRTHLRALRGGLPGYKKRNK